MKIGDTVKSNEAGEVKILHIAFCQTCHSDKIGYSKDGKDLKFNHNVKEHSCVCMLCKANYEIISNKNISYTDITNVTLIKELESETLEEILKKLNL